MECLRISICNGCRRPVLSNDATLLTCSKTCMQVTIHRKCLKNILCRQGFTTKVEFICESCKTSICVHTRLVGMPSLSLWWLFSPLKYFYLLYFLAKYYVLPGLVVKLCVWMCRDMVDYHVGILSYEYQIFYKYEDTLLCSGGVLNMGFLHLLMSLRFYMIVVIAWTVYYVARVVFYIVMDVAGYPFVSMGTKIKKKSM